MKLRLVLEELSRSGWNIVSLPKATELPREVVERYPWFPSTYRELAQETESIVGPDNKAWFLTVGDYAGSAGSAYAWNEWERQSLDAAEDNEEWQLRIKAFWDDHLPIFTSVKSGYAYFAIERSSLKIVHGEEPEYEKTTEVATSVEELFGLIARRDDRLNKWL